MKLPKWLHAWFSGTKTSPSLSLTGFAGETVFEKGDVFNVSYEGYKGKGVVRSITYGKEGWIQVDLDMLSLDNE